MSLRTLLSAVLALAVLFAPAVTHAAATHAGIPDHQMQMMEAGHCSSMPSGHHDKSDGKSCCISVYVGLAAASSAPVTEIALPASPPMYFVVTFHRPYLGEIATPPPRHS
jgi:hypothetical protein